MQYIFANIFQHGRDYHAFLQLDIALVGVVRFFENIIILNAEICAFTNHKFNFKYIKLKIANFLKVFV